MKHPEVRARSALKRLDGIERPVMAEIGAGAGRMAAALLALHPTLRLHQVDSYRTVTEQPAAYVATKDNFALRDAATTAHQRAEVLNLGRRYPGRVVLHEMDSADAARNFTGGSLALVFIDADHSYAGVKRDIAIWLPKVMRGGWIGGHDYGNADPRFDFSGVKRAVDEFGRVCYKDVEIEANPTGTVENYTWWVRV